MQIHITVCKIIYKYIKKYKNLQEFYYPLGVGELGFLGGMVEGGKPAGKGRSLFINNYNDYYIYIN